MPGFGREVLFLIHQFLEEKKYTNAIPWLERDSGFYFDMKYFEDVVTNGEWDDVEKYLYVFTKDDDNVYSLEMFFEIKKQKYLEALDKPDYVKAVEILRKELTVFSTTHDEVLNKMTLLLRLPNFRENAELSKYGDTKQARSNLLGMLKNLIKKNPLFQDKLQFPNMENSRLLTLIEQSLNWQHNLCKNPKPHPGFKTLFVDHSCGQRYGARALSGMTTQLTSSLPEFGGFPPLVTSGPGASPHEMFHTPGGPKGLSARNNADSEPVKKRARPLGSLDEVNNPVTCPGQTHPHTSYSSDELPKMLVATLSYNSSVKSMDFHPVQQTFLLVGTNTGDIVLWEVGNPMHASKEFKVYNLRACSESLQVLPTLKNIVHLYSFHGGNSLGFHFHLQIEAHVGYVSDLAFSHTNKRCIITCGEDKAVKVWDGATGANLYNFVGHEAPVYSVCPRHRKHTQITKLIYTNSGGAILALASNGIHKLWKWHKNEQNRDGKATVNVLPELWQPASGRLMTNDISDTKPEDAVPCLAPTKNDGFVISGSGGQISVFNNITFETMTTCMPPPSAATSLALNPQDNNILALGMQDSSIHIFNTEIHKVTGKLEGHQDRVTGLAFSILLNALVSSGADGQICVWSMDGWKKQASEFVHIPYGRAPSPRIQNHVQFHQDQTHLLVSNENLIAIYEAPELTCIEKWFPGNISGSVTCATYSCDSQSVYAGFESGNIIVFSAALSPQCLISPKAYLTTSLSSPSTRVYPLDIAAHPNDPNQFAVGLSDGGVLVFEPLESERRWCTITISSSWNQKEDGVL